MTHDQLRDQYALVAIGAADPPERDAIIDHLRRGCPICVEQMRRARALSGLILCTAPPAAPAPRLRRRILASAGLEQRRFGWAPWLGLALALALFAAFYFASRERQIALDREALRNEMGQQTIQLTRLREAVAVLSSPSAVVVPFGPAPQGRVYIDRDRGVLLIASGLPPLPAGKSYEMWTVPRGGRPAAAGLFEPGPEGNAMRLQAGGVAAALAAVLVTVENQAGAAQPTTRPVIEVAVPPVPRR